MERIKLIKKKVLVCSIIAAMIGGCNYGTTNTVINQDLAAKNKPNSVPNDGVIPVKLYIVNQDNQFTKVSNLHFSQKASASKADIVIDSSNKYQVIDGFGAALTDSSAYLLYHLPSAERHKLLQKIFASGQTNFSIIRVPLGASDFSLNNYTYDDQLDFKLSKFSISHDDEYIIPLIKEIQQINPTLKIIATPWSAPAWMKTNHSYFGVNDGEVGELSPEFMQIYAQYLTKSVLAYQLRGININYLTIQNEPLHAPDNYGGMYMTAQQQHVFIDKYLSHQFISNNISTKVLAYDHNWDHPEYPEEVISNLSSAGQHVMAGTAYHCYGGDVRAQSATHDLFTHQKIFMTECSGGDWATNFNDNLIWDMDNLFIGVLNNWGNGSTKWNLALDQNHGPYVGGCTNCRGLLTINTANNSVKFNEDFYSTASMSKFIQNGAYRVKVVSRNNDLKATAVLNPDNTITLVMANDLDKESQFVVDWGNKTLKYNITAKSVNIITWNNNTN